METIVRIKWDKPEEQAWLCVDNIKFALEQACSGQRGEKTKFRVEEVASTTYRKKHKKEK